MPEPSYRDALFTTPLDEVASFSFDEQVVQCFPDMIRRSVPGYGQIIGMIGVVAKRFVPEGGHIHDLGCSLGACTLAICQQLPPEAFTLDAIDLSPAMIARARDTLASHHPMHRVQLREGDIRYIDYAPSDMIVLNFTLQFLPPEERDAVIALLAEALKPGGVLVLSEKVRFDNEDAERLLFDLHHDFKRANGYSDMEISQKRSALEDVMITDSMSTHIDRLERAGLVGVTPWFQHLNFASLLAFKPEAA
ncbi:carboxy-S-adenosyl-L-methionine synthase CmoA [Larsenimonas salina]|uniref:carboxy-S-adenosyl-L-methionine synthase CmoA n=1 Tax=Larsenimonas salina TaxID=1295565 RepID=UPI0020742A3C|nr:carboxy-S-adenosyl-L-methionine synthase CmoA [Larsenimonas salina]MCM5704828.1 carboxy-S-adenosyl-L-methionine synthase CmoA [Larsenimonas salina]